MLTERSSAQHDVGQRECALQSMTRRCSEQSVCITSLETQLKAAEERVAELQRLSDTQAANMQQCSDVAANLERMYSTLEKQAATDKRMLQVGWWPGRRPCMAL